MADSIRWGILGAGRIAGTVGADIMATPGNELVAVGARDPERAAALAGRLGAARSYGSYPGLVADADLDVVYIATTHGQHHEHALLALRAGRPVLVEKAFTLNAREAREVVAEARQRRLFCMEAMWMRFNPLVRTAQDLAASGRIGDVISVRADVSGRFEFDPAHRLFDLAVGGGALLDMGVYTATFAWLFLGRPDTVAATGFLSPTGSDVTVATQWAYDTGRFAQLASTTLGPNRLPGLIAGTAGWISLSAPVYRSEAMTIHDTTGDEVLTDELPGHGYQPQVREVERCLRAGELESPLAPLDETIAILDVLDDVRAQIGVRYAADRE
jgi:predicted dehydrogenase